MNRSPFCVALSLAVLAFVATTTPRVAEAQTSSCGGETVAASAVDGLAPTAMPGIFRVPVASVGEEGLSVAGTATFGYTEHVLFQLMDPSDVNSDYVSAGDSHQRFGGILAGAYRVTPWLTLGLREEIRYDKHSDGEDGVTLLPILSARAATSMPGGLRLGVQLAVHAWGGDFSVFSTKAFETFTFDAQGLVSYTPEGSPLTISGFIGYRLDNSYRSVTGSQSIAADATGFAPPTNADQYSNSDRLALGVSEANALLLGVGATYSLNNKLQLLAEGTMDYLLTARSDGGSLGGYSPLRIDAGVRYAIARNVHLTVLGELSLASRPSLGIDRRLTFNARDPLLPASDPRLFPIEPKVSLLATISYQFGVQGDALPTTICGTQVRGRVLRRDNNAPIAGASIQVSVGEESRRCTSEDDGTFRCEDVPNGNAIVEASGNGFSNESHNVTVSIDSGVVEVPDFHLSAQMACSGQCDGTVRGLVLGADGSPMQGVRVRVSRPGTGNDDPFATPTPGFETTVTTDAQGRYIGANVPRGSLQVTASPEGMDPQTQNVEVPGTDPVRLDFRFGGGAAGSVLRGTVRSYNGLGLQATIVIQQLNRELTAQGDGTFEVPVPAGTYDVLISARGHRQQRRRVTVDPGGVTVMNVDMQRGR